MRKRRGFAIKMLAVLICSLMVLSLTAAGAAADGDMPAAEESEISEINEDSSEKPEAFESSETEPEENESSEKDPEAFEGFEKGLKADAGLKEGIATKTGMAKGAEGVTGGEDDPAGDEGDPASGGIGLINVLTDGGTLSSGYYYLANDVTLSKTVIIPSGKDVTIDLNGHVLDRGLTSAEENGCVIYVDGHLTITDSQPDAEHNPAVTFTSGFDDSEITVKGGVITGGYNSGDGGGIFASGVLYFTAGTVAGNTGNKGGGIYNDNDCYVIMTGGKILANISTDTSDGGGGGGIANRGYLTIKGGTISDNRIAEGQHGCGIRQYEGTLEISGGLITRHNANRGAGMYVRGGTATMSGGEISGNTAASGGGVSVTNKSVQFIMKGGKISGNTASYGGGVAGFNSTNLTMEGGTVSDNNSSAEGGGVFADGKVTFTMSGGEISGNVCRETGSLLGGGGVCVRGTFNMSGGTISGNQAYEDGGGVCIHGEFNMSGGRITGNTATFGGGVYVMDNTGIGDDKNGGKFVLTAGEISGNEAQYLAGGVYVQRRGEFTMSGGTIIGNEVKSARPNGTDGHGGGVFILQGGSFTMNGGFIVNNSAPVDGGGVYNGGTFTASGSQITGNIAGRDGGGVYTKNNTEFQSVSIQNNIAAGKGGGVFPKTNAVTTVSGKVNISGNKGSSGASDFMLTSEKGISVSNKLTGKIGVDTDNPDLIITSCDATLATHSQFTSNVAGYTINSEGWSIVKDIVFVPIQYNVYVNYVENGFVYVDKTEATVNETVKVTVSPDPGFVLSQLSYILENHAIETVTADENNEYTFKMPASSVVVTATFLQTLPGSVNISGTAVYGQTLTASYTDPDSENPPIVSYQWRRDGTDIENATGDTYTLTADDVGHEITCAAANPAYAGEVVSGPVTAGKAPITVKAHSKKSGYGEPLMLLTYSVEGSYVKEDKLDISLSTTAKQTSDAGDYPITVACGNNPNYEIEAVDGTYTIEKADWKGNGTSMSVKRGGSGEADLASFIEKGGKCGTLSVTPDDILIGASIQGTTLTASVKNDARAGSQAVVTVPVTGAKNYNDYTFTVTVTVLEKDAQTISFAEASVEKYFGDEDFTVTADHPEGDGEVTYEVTSGSDVASVDRTSGKVSIFGDGTAVITATAAETENCIAASASYTLVVNPAYFVTVVNGDSSGYFAEGADVAITAKAAPEGQVFDGWTSDDGVGFTDASSEKTSFTMPGKAVTVTANYKVIILKVTFADEKGTEITSSDVEYGKTVDEPAITVPDGYKLDGWYQDKAFTKAFDFGTPVTADTTVYVKWTAIGYVVTDITGVTADNAHTWTRGSGKAVVITIKPAEGEDHSFSHFTGVEIDGKALKEGVDYTAREGSTVVTVKSETMEALSDGAHTAAVQFDNGTAEVKLTVQKAADSKPPAKDKDTTPKTGDTNDTAFHVILIVAAAAAIAAVSAALPAKRKQSGK